MQPAHSSHRSISKNCSLSTRSASFSVEIIKTIISTLLIFPLMTTNPYFANLGEYIPMNLFYVNWQIRGKFRRFPVNRSAFSVIAGNFKFLQIMQLVCADVLI